MLWGLGLGLRLGLGLGLGFPYPYPYPSPIEILFLALFYCPLFLCKYMTYGKYTYGISYKYLFI